MRNGHTSRRMLSALAVILVFALPVAAYASSYTTSIDYTWRIFGATRSYTHNSMNISLTSRTTDGSQGSHTVRLYRDRTWPTADDFIGSKALPRNGTGGCRWSGTGPGKYYFNFEKTKDGVRVYSNNVKMWCD